MTENLVTERFHFSSRRSNEDYVPEQQFNGTSQPLLVLDGNFMLEVKSATEKKDAGGNNPMKSMLWSFLVVSILIGADVAQAGTVTYTFVGAAGTSGTNWTLVDPDGFLTVPSGNVIGLVQTATDLILVDPMTGPEDFGPLTNITVGNPPLEPAYYGIQLGSSSFTLAALFIPKADFTTPGTYELADLADLRGNFAPDQGALTITATPEPSSVALTLSGVGLG